MQTVSQKEMRRTASRILAAAALELFPHTILIQGGETSLGFYYDFQFPFLFKKEFFPLLEEKMRHICKEERPIQILDMVPSNAAAFLEHHRHPVRAEAAQSVVRALVEVLKMGSFIDLCEGGAAADSSQIGFFKLQEVQVRQNGICRIIGSAFASKQELKEFLKKRERYPSVSHQQLGEDLSLFSWSEVGWIWYPKGQMVRKLLVDFWNELHLDQNFDIIHSSSLDRKTSHRVYAQKKGVGRVAELGPLNLALQEGVEGEPLAGLFESKPCSGDLAHIFCKPGQLENEVISSLQFIVKISKIFNFECEVFQCSSLKKKQDEWLERTVKSSNMSLKRDDDNGQRREYPTLEIRVPDALGRQWSFASLQINCEENVLMRSLYVSLERLVALLLESDQGELPFWLAPEQVRVVAVTAAMKEEAEEMARLLRSEGLRAFLDCTGEKLGKRVHLALHDKVPYCVFVGEREAQLNRVTLKATRTGKEERMSHEEVVQQLHVMNRKSRFEN